MSTRQDDPQFRDLCNWYAGEAHPDDVRQPKDIRWLVYWIIGLCVAAVFFMWVGRVEAATVTVDTVGYQINLGSNNKISLSRVASVPLNKECIETMSATDQYRTVYVIKDRLWAVMDPNPAKPGEFMTRPRQVWAKCGQPVANRVPTISGTPPSTATVGQVYSFAPSASDPDGDKLTFVVDNRPPWATLDTTTGKLSGTPAAGDVGVRSEIRVRVSDGRGGEATLAFGKLTTVLAATPTAGSVTLSWPPTTANCDGTPATELAGYQILYGTSASALDRTIDVPANVSKYLVTQLTPGTWYFAVKARHSSGADCGQSPIASELVP